MAIYEYTCEANQNHDWETTQSIHDAPLTTCPTCGAAARRLISRTSFALKGSGWASTGYGAAPASGGSSGSSSPAPAVSDAAVAAATTCPTIVPKT